MYRYTTCQITFKPSNSVSNLKMYTGKCLSCTFYIQTLNTTGTSVKVGWFIYKTNVALCTSCQKLLCLQNAPLGTDNPAVKM